MCFSASLTPLLSSLSRCLSLLSGSFSSEFAVILCNGVYSCIELAVKYDLGQCICVCLTGVLVFAYISFNAKRHSKIFLRQLSTFTKISVRSLFFSAVGSEILDRLDVAPSTLGQGFTHKPKTETSELL